MTPPSIPPLTNAPQRTTLHYSVTRWDILRWQIYVLIRNRVLNILFLIVSLAYTYSELRTPEMIPRSVGFKVFFTVIFAGTMFCFMVIATTIFVSFTVIFKKFRGFLGDHELEIRDEGLVERTDVNETVNRWNGFHKMVNSGRYLYIYVTDNNVHIVPRRYFTSESDQRAYMDEIQGHINLSVGK